MLQLMTFTKQNKSIWMQFATTLWLCFTCRSIITYHPLSSHLPSFPHSQGCNWIWFVAAPGPLCCLWEWERFTQAAPEQKPAQAWQRWLPWVLWLTHASVSESWLCLHDRKQTENRELQVWTAVMLPISVYNSNLGCWCLATTTQLQYVSDDIWYKQIRHQ